MAFILKPPAVAPRGIDPEQTSTPVAEVRQPVTYETSVGPRTGREDVVETVQVERREPIRSAEVESGIETERGQRDNHSNIPRAETVEAPATLNSFWEQVKEVAGAIPQEENGPRNPVAAAPEVSKIRSSYGEKYRFLGQILVDEGAITEEQLRSALEEQTETFERIGEILRGKGLVSEAQIQLALDKQKPLRTLENVLRMLGLKVNHIRSALMRIEGRNEPIRQVMRDTGYLSEEEVALAIAALSGLQYFRQDRMNKSKFAEMASKGIKIEQYAGFAPVAVLDNETLCIAIENEDVRNEAHNHFVKWEKKVYVIGSSRTLQKIFCNHFSRTEEHMLAKIREAEAIIAKEDEASQDGFVRKLIGYILRHGCYSGASDIHMKESRDIATLSMRYDGVLKDIAVYDKRLHQRITTQLRTDGLASNTLGAGTIDAMREGAINFDNDKSVREMFKDILDAYGFRLELGIMVRDHKSAVIRIIDSHGTTADLDNLGFDAETRETIDSCIHSSDGMILLVGPTGSGKTTTLYAAMGEIDAEEFSIQTIENPVEGEHGKWMQFQVSNRGGHGEGQEMSLIFKGQMRNDPDVILVGEIRDAEVADTAVQAAKTGHIVFSTLHVTDAASVLTRLLGLKVDRQDVADTVKLVIAQRLVRKLCSNCSIEDAREATKRRFEKALESYLADIESPRFRMARDGGCKECRNTGYRGRVMAYESIRFTKKIRKMVERGATTLEIEEAAIPPGRSMFEVGMRYVANGVTSIEELLRSVDDKTEE